ncbi:MAG: NUDIX domain-containing protein [bacterium]
MSTPLYQVLVNAIVSKDNKILISQRSFEEEHMPGRWTIPGGKVEETKGDVWNILELNIKKEVMEETGVKVQDKMQMICNNTFVKANGTHVVAIMFLTKWKSGKPKALEDTIDIKWISIEEVDNYDFPPNVKDYILKGFMEMRNN